MDSGAGGPEKARLLADHYQHTFEMTWRLWNRRNQTFIYLLVTVAVASLLSFDPKLTNEVMAGSLPKLLQIEVSTDLAARFPYTIIHLLMLPLVFYFTTNLYSHTVAVLRSYAYLAAVERQIRTLLDMKDGEPAFTREGDYYWTKRSPLMGWVKVFYMLVLGLLLGAFFGFRIWNGWMLLHSSLGEARLDQLASTLAAAGASPRALQAVALLAFDAVFALLTLIVFYGYACQSLRSDHRNPASEPRPQFVHNPRSGWADPAPPAKRR